MEKGYWNRKRVYSIRKFTVGACSVLIGTCAVLFGATLSAGNPVYAEEVAVNASAESVKEEGKIEEEHSDKLVATSESSETSDASPALSTQENSSEKKEENSSSPKIEKEFSESVKNEAKETSESSTQEGSEKAKMKSATEEEVSQMIEDRKVNFNQNWHFKLNANAKEAVKEEADVTSWKKLDLPHDWSIHFDFDHDSPAQN